MQESFLHYIWQLQYFDHQALSTVNGEPLHIGRPGTLNSNAGPDFNNAKIRIDGIAWAGTVEIHLKSSEWNTHAHHLDKAYDNVILHVVWQNDKPVVRHDGSELPTVVLRGRVDESLIFRYRKLMASSFAIPCAAALPSVPEIIRIDMRDKALVQRLEKKASEVLDLLRQNGNDWEETTYQLLARNFGFKVNAEPFFRLAKSIGYKHLRRHADHPIQVEALIFGQAGFLDRPVKDVYHRQLRKEYKFLEVKYGLSATRLDASLWKFLRMRPANFPTMRLAQFCNLIARQHHLFSGLLMADSYSAMKRVFEAGQMDYWKEHYSFGAPARHTTTKMGSASIDNILINTVCPILVAYGKDRDDPSLIERAEELLHHIETEENSIVRRWNDIGWRAQSAFDSQALIELYHLYCVPRRCLQCTIGSSLLKPKQ